MPTVGPLFDYPARFYLDKYYSSVGAENAAFMRAIRSAVTPDGQLGTVVELGGGPSLCGMFSMVAATERGPERVIWVDAAVSNLEEVEAWLSGKATAFDYTAIFRWLEREVGVSAAEVAYRLRRATWDMRAADLRDGLPADLNGVGDVVASYFVAECASDRESDFVELTRRVADASRPGARVVLAYIRGSGPYRLDGDELFPALAVYEWSLPRLLDAAGVRLRDRVIRRGPLDDPPGRPGYDGMAFVYGRRDGA